MTDHPTMRQSDMIDQYSYNLGITAAFAEVVAMGCKPLALSSPYDDAELAALLAPTQRIAERHGVLIAVEPDLLVTALFPDEVAAGKSVMLIARDQQTLDSYYALKQRRAAAIAEDRLATVQVELGWEFGRLLGYADDAIERLLERRTRTS